MHCACAVLHDLWPVWLYHIFPRYLINDTIFGIKLLNLKCVFCLAVQILYEMFHIIKSIQLVIDDTAHV